MNVTGLCSVVFKLYNKATKEYGTVTKTDT